MPALNFFRQIIRCHARWWAVGCLFLTYSSVAQAPLDVRVALVIGNAAYENVPALMNSSNDAKAMASVLRTLGFQVVEVLDGNKSKMEQAIDNLQSLLKGRQAVAMLYYAGHGLQLDWHNYMVPVDAKLSRAVDVQRETVDIESVINTFRKVNTRMNIIVLDACRDNPFPEKASGKGLAQLDAPPGTYLAFATAPGNVAEDGDEASGNGLFTKYLLKELQKPARIEDVFKRVRLQVRKKSEGRQIPWDSSSLEDDFSFNDGVKYTINPDEILKQAEQAKQREAQLKISAEVALQREKQIAEQQALEQQRLAQAQKIQDLQGRLKAEVAAKERERELAFLADQERQRALMAAQALERARTEELQRLKEIEIAKAQASEEALRKTLSQEEARARQFAQEKAEWDKIKESKNPDDFYGFLNKFPSGLIAQQATFLLESLAKAKITAQIDRNGIKQVAGEARFKLGDVYAYARIDDFTGHEVARVTERVAKIENGLVYLEGNAGPSVRTLDGAILKISGGSAGLLEFDPPLITLPGDELAVGKKWSMRTIQKSPRGGSVWREESFKIVGFEEITIPAGTFKAFKIQSSVMLQSGFRAERTYWAEPGWAVVLKSKRVLWSLKGVVENETSYLLSRTRGDS